ncbi:MAG: hypothetical protein AB1629_04945 [Candidatus Omnitrophota bacterium]
MLNQHAQSVTEYMLLLLILLIAMLSMSVYIRRAISGRINQEGEDIGERYQYGGATVSRDITWISRDITTDVVFEGNAGDSERIVKTNVIVRKDDSNSLNTKVLYKVK